MENQLTSLVSQLQIELQKEQKKLKEERTDIESRRNLWEQSQVGISKEKVHFPSKIKLDIGGTSFTTSLSTLTTIGGTFFSAMFSGKIQVQPDKDGSYFIDRDPTVFPLILNFLRGIFPDFKVLSKKEVFALKSDAQFYQLDDLEEMITEEFKRKTFAWMPERSCKLTNDNCTATKSGGSNWDCVVMGSEELSVGVVVWEYIFDRVSSDRSGMAVGLCKPDCGAGSYSSVIGFGMTGSGYGGVTIQNSSFIVSATKIRVKADFDSARIEFYVDKTLVASGSIPVGIYKACVFLYYNNDAVTLNFDVDQN